MILGSFDKTKNYLGLIFILILYPFYQVQLRNVRIYAGDCRGEICGGAACYHGGGQAGGMGERELSFQIGRAHV